MRVFRTGVRDARHSVFPFRFGSGVRFPVRFLIEQWGWPDSAVALKQGGAVNPP